MTLTAAVRRPFHRRLDFRLALAFALALLPLGLVSALQSRSLLNEARARSEAALLGETLLAIAPQADMIRSARVASGTLAASMTVLAQDAAACRLVMNKVIESHIDGYSFATFVPLSGIASCSSNGKTIDLSGRERFASQRKNPQPDVVVIRNGIGSGTSVLAFGHPVFDRDDGYLGYVSISVPHSILETKPQQHSYRGDTSRREPISLTTFNREGEVLTSTSDLGLNLVSGDLPADQALEPLAKNRASTFTALSNAGAVRTYAVIPLIENSIYAIGSWPVVATAGPLSLLISPFLMPVLMWLACLLVAVLATERLITRHIRELRKSITSFASGNYKVADLDMPDAAIEIREVADSYLTMTDTILHNEAELEGIVKQREVLLREVHHRVKNNLQLIASIMNMQMRQAHSAEAKVLMKSLQDRVMSLATIHRGLYQTTGLTDVRADELLSDILRQILKMSTGPGLRFDVTTDFDEISLTPDQAVPLSLLLTEALTNAVKYAGSNTGTLPKLEVTLRREGLRDAVLTITNDTSGEKREPESGTGLGSQLLSAFAQQLSAHTTITTDDETYRLRVQFELRSLEEADAFQLTESPETP